MAADPKGVSLALRLPPLALVFLVAGLMVIVGRVLPAGNFYLALAKPVSAVLAAVGLIVAVSGVVAFRAAGTTVDPRYPERTTQLVQRGVYSLTRNPMYLGFLLLLLAWGVYLGNAGAFALLPPFVLYMNRFQIAPEERCMRELFGDEFDSYARRVRRWI